MREVGILSASEAYAPRGGTGTAIPGPSPKFLQMGLTATTLVVQALLSRLATRGRLETADAAQVETFVLDAARRLQAQLMADSREDGTRLEREVLAFSTALSPDRGDEAHAERAQAGAMEDM